MKASVRAYAGPDDLRAMQELTARIWRHGARWHVGDLAWNRFPREASADWPTMLWEREGTLRGWGWMQEPGELDLAVDPHAREIAPQVLDWFENACSGGAVVVLDREAHLRSALEARGYREVRNAPFWLHVARGLDALPPPALPPGFRARPLDCARDVARRAALHRAAWEKLPFADGDRSNRSRVTEARYDELIRTAPYRPDLDWVIETPDGELAASCCAWLDARNGVGELEPVGTHPSYRRTGLARAVCLHALHALRAVGASEAVVHPRGDAAYPVPARLYSSLGFQPDGRTRTFRRE